MLLRAGSRLKPFSSYRRVRARSGAMPAGWWIADQGGSMPDATDYRTPAVPSGTITRTAGILGPSLSFSSGGHFSVGTWNLGYTFGYSVWVYPTTSNTLGFIMGDGPGANGLFQWNDGTYVLYVFGGVNHSASTVQVGQWTHIYAGFDAAGNAQLYINGQLDASMGRGSATQSGVTIFIGSDNFGRPFVGSIASAALYNGQIPTAREIAADYLDPWWRLRRRERSWINVLSTGTTCTMVGFPFAFMTGSLSATTPPSSSSTLASTVGPETLIASASTAPPGNSGATLAAFTGETIVATASAAAPPSSSATLTAFESDTIAAVASAANPPSSAASLAAFVADLLVASATFTAAGSASATLGATVSAESFVGIASAAAPPNSAANLAATSGTAFVVLTATASAAGTALATLSAEVTTNVAAVASAAAPPAASASLAAVSWTRLVASATPTAPPSANATLGAAISATFGSVLIATSPSGAPVSSIFVSPIFASGVVRAPIFGVGAHWPVYPGGAGQEPQP